jgi:diguanylate cyclase (GGDEF)-like protein
MESQSLIKVLYIEDDVGDRILLRKLLSKPPFEFFEASTGLDGLKIALKEHPNIIIMDIDLPDIRGDELTTKIKNTQELKDVVVVALTALKEKNTREQTLVAGCDGFLTKPIEIQQFPDQLLQFIEGKKESLDVKEKEFYQDQYQAAIVDHLTSKVNELQVSNRKLENTSKRLQDYNEHLENVLSILSSLQLCHNPYEFKKALVNGIYERFKFDRCAFIDVDTEQMTMQIKHACGIDPKAWNEYNYPFNSPFFQHLFENTHILMVRNLSQIEDRQLRSILEKIEAEQFIFAYLGTPIQQMASDDIRKRVLPLLESYMPSLHDKEDEDINVILEHLEEYLSSESLYRAGFIFLDNFRSKRRIIPNEYRFIETLLRTSSYMYQNLSLMEQLRFLFVKAEKEAITDPLTDLFNYRYFIHQLNREISRDQRHNSIFSLIMIDIDFFKNYNDAFGHQAGDLILRRIAQAIMENTRTSDIVCRYGGEEFVIISPELSKQDAKRMAEKLRQIVEKLELPQIKTVPTGKLTISSGVASFPEDGNTTYQLILNADKAMYKAKETGRNKVCVTA